MLTFTQRKQLAADTCGIQYREPAMKNIVTHINHADKQFQNAARRAWTRKERSFDLSADTQYYTLDADMHRVSTVRCRLSSGSNVTNPLTEVQSEEDWNRLNSYPFSTTYPTHYFIRGFNEVGIYPCPSEDVTDGLIISYEPRIRDMGVDDIKFKANVTKNGVYVENPDNTGMPGGFKNYMANGDFWVTTDSGEDGNWYRVEEVVSTSKIRISPKYLGQTGTQVELTMGQVPPFPEEYHDAAINFAAYKFFSMRKDTDSAAMYKTLYDDALNKYRETYGSKTTSGIINPGKHRVPNLTDVFKMGELTEGA